MSESADHARAAEASQWFTVMKRPEVSPQDLERFRIWRRDAANAAAFEKVQRAWDAAGGLAERPAIAAAVDAAMAAHPGPGTGAGAGVAGPKRRFVLQPLLIGLVGLVMVGGGLTVWRGLAPDYATGVGEQRLAVLSDGSRVRLNTDTRLRVAFKGEERRVVLERGQAFFEVAHDASRPFIVEADGARVRALGTKFDVRREGSDVRVTLLQGKVQVQGAAGARAVLVPGQAVVADRRGVSAPVVANAAAVASWTTGQLTFSGMPLRQAVAEVNRYSERKIVLDAPEAIGGELVSGQFAAGDVENFVAGVRSLYGLKVTSQTPREIRLAPG